MVIGSPAVAQELHQEVQELLKAEVLEVVAEYERDIMGTQASTTVQELRIIIKQGERSGEVVRLENDLIKLEKGDDIFVIRLENIDGTEYFTFKDVERRSPLIFLVIIFIALVVWLSGRQGVRAVLSLGLSISAILFVLIPALKLGSKYTVADQPVVVM